MADAAEKNVKSKYTKKKSYFNNSKKHFLEPGQHGFLATCNFKQKDCIRECYNILNDYADKVYGPSESVEHTNTESVQTEEQIDNNECHDINDDLQKQIQAIKSEPKSAKFRFQAMETGVTNCVFIKTTLPDPVKLGTIIIEDIATTRKQRCRFLLRLIPIAIVTRANESAIIEAANNLFDKEYFKEEKTFSVVFNKRYNNVVKKDEIIEKLAQLIKSKNSKNKVDLKNAQLSVIVEIIKGLCCFSAVPNYLKYKKYNLVELAAKE